MWVGVDGGVALGVCLVGVSWVFGGCFIGVDFDGVDGVDGREVEGVVDAVRRRLVVGDEVVDLGEHGEVSARVAAATSAVIMGRSPNASKPASPHLSQKYDPG